VNADWNKTAAELNDMDAATGDVAAVSDGDGGIVTAFADESHDHQLNLIHVGRTLDYYLSEDGIFPLVQRNEIVSEVIDEVFHLSKLVANHRPNEEFARSASGSPRMTERMEKTAWQLGHYGSEKSARYLQGWLPSIVTFAEAAVEGFEIPGPQTLLDIISMGSSIRFANY